MGEHRLRFLKILIYHGFVLWDIEELDETYFMTIKMTDFLKLRPYVKKAKVKVRMQQKQGLPFYLLSWKRHAWIITCIVLCFALLYYSSSFLWSIKFDGNLLYTEDVLRAFLEDEKIEIGMRKTSIPCEELELRIRNQFPLITWVSCELKGTYLYIHVNENRLEHYEFDEEGPSSLVANQDCVVTKIVVQKGTPMVKQGDVIKEGDLLISGVLPLKGDYDEVYGEKQVCSRGTILGIFAEEGEMFFPRIVVKKIPEKKQESGICLELFGMSFAFVPKKPETTFYMIRQKERQVPVGWISFCQFISYKEKQVTYTDDELSVIANDWLENYYKEKEKNKVQILKKNGTMKFTANGCTVTYQLQLEGEVGIRCPISNMEKGAKEESR